MKARATWAAGAGLVVAGVVAVNLTASLVGVFYDDGIYLALARSVAEGHGYRLLYLPGAPGAVTYPFLYPAFLGTLWKAFPAFPANVALFKAANAALLGVFAALLVAYLSPRLVRRPWVAALLVVAGATALPLVTVSTVLFSEPLFLVLLIASCWVGDAARRAERRTAAFTLAAVAGLLAGATALTRSVGVTVLGAITLSLLLVRRPRAAVIALLAGALCLAPWALWVARHHGDADPVLTANYGTYFDLLRQSGWAWISPASVLDLAGPAGAVALAPFHGWLRVCLGVPALLVLVSGFAPLLAAVPALGWVLLAYLGVIFLWPYGPDRFLWAAWPLLTVTFYAGSRRTWQRLSKVAGRPALLGRGAIAAVATAVLVGYGFYQVRGYARRDVAHLQDGISATMARVLPWIRESTPPSAVIAGADEALIWLYTGRSAVPSSVWRHRGRGGESLGPDSLRAWFDRAGVTHVLLSGPGSDAAATVNQLLGRYPGYLRVVQAWPGPELAFEVERPGPVATGRETK